MWFFLFKQKKEDEMRISDCSSDVCASDRREDDRDDHADDGDGGVLAAEIGLRAFLDGGGDVLHLLVARGRAQHLLACDETVDDGKQAARDRGIEKRHWLTLSPAPIDRKSTRQKSSYQCHTRMTPTASKY